jgi:hypothetical protein
MVIHAGRAEISDTFAISELTLMEMKMNAVHEMKNTSMVMKYLPLGHQASYGAGAFSREGGT